MKNNSNIQGIAYNWISKVVPNALLLRLLAGKVGLREGGEIRESSEELQELGVQQGELLESLSS